MKKFFIFIFILSSFALQAQKAVNGVLDLSKVDLKNNSIQISGEWEFYWEQLADPDSIDQMETDYYEFPKLWNGGATRNGTLLNSSGYATYRLKVALPPRTPNLSISINEVYCAYKMYVNGFEFSENGRVSKTAENAKEDWLPKTVNIARLSDTLTFVLQVSNFSHSKGGSREPIIIGDRKVLTAARDFNLSYDFLLNGSLIMGGLFFLGLFLFGQHEKSVLFFALFCITFSYRMIGSGEYALHALFPDMSWQFLIRTEYLSLFIPPGIFTIYSYLLYPEDSRKEILLGFSVISGLFAVCAVFTPTLFFTQLVEPYLVLILIMIFYLAYVYWLAFKRGRIGSQYALGSTGIVFLVAFYLISVYFSTALENTFLSFIGFILFFFFQSLILSFRFAYSLKKAKDAAEAASRAKTDFLSTISHEIRTPLNAVVGISHFLINEDPSKDQVESLESLQFSAEHLTALINDILDYNKLESGLIEFEFAETNLKELTTKLIKTHTAIAKDKGLNLILDFDENIHPHVMADTTRIYQVLNNLINNSLKFTSNGFVKVRASLLHEDDHKQKLRCEVSDSGIGIPKNKQKLIFERFTQAGSSTTREYGGTGLGLAIIKRILNLVGSEIFVESQEGKGTTFWFDLTFTKIMTSAVEIQEEDEAIDRSL
ncbi:MAG: sensor histidine kinase, partial [Ekhidna sp.]